VKRRVLAHADVLVGDGQHLLGLAAEGVADVEEGGPEARSSRLGVDARPEEVGEPLPALEGALDGEVRQQGQGLPGPEHQAPIAPEGLHRAQQLEANAGRGPSLRVL